MTVINQITSFKISGFNFNGSSTELNYTAGVVAGTGQASKALVLNSNSSITSGINSLTMTSVVSTNVTTNNLTVNGTVFNTNILNNLVTLDGAIAGTAVASKVLIVDSNRDILNIRNMTVTSLTGTLNTASQPNITSVGTLTGLTSSGAVSITNNTASINSTTGALTITGGLGVGNNVNIAGNLAATNITGTLTTALQPNITSIGTLTGLTSSGAVSITNSTASTTSTTGALTITGGLGVGNNVNIGGNLSASNITGTLVTASQPNITSIGTVTGLTSSGTVSITNSTASTNSTSGALTITGGLGVGNNVNIAGNLLATNITGTLLTASQPNITTIGTLTGLTSGGAVTITNATASNNTTSGALVVTGGVGIGNNLNVSGTTTSTSFSGTIITSLQPNITSIGTLTGLTSSGVVNITNNTASTTSSTGALIITGGLGVGNNVNIAGNLSATNITGTLTTASQPNITSLGTLSSLTSSGTVTITNSTISTSSSTGALVVTGGVGVGGALNVGGNINGTIGTASQPNITSLGTLTSLTTSGIVSITNNTHSTTTTNGALVVTGGVGIGNNLNVAGNLSALNITGTLQTGTQSNITSLGTLTGLTSSGVVSITDNTLSTSTTTGALTITGGVGIGNNLNITGYSKSSQLLLGTSTDTASTRFISALDSTMTNASAKFICFGKANSIRNQAEMTYFHVSDGSTNNALYLGFNGNNSIVTVRADSRVGIGITSPTQALDVIGVIKSSARLLIGTSTETGITRLISALDSSMSNLSTRTIAFGKDTSNNNSIEMYYLHNSDASTSNRLGIGFWGSGERFTLLANGNVGIANTAPSFRLDVNGSFNCTTFNIGGTAITSTAAELNYLDITTIGTAEASKAIVLDSNRDIINIRNLTATLITANSSSITDSTASTSTTTGALVVTGGVGIGGALNVGGNINGLVGTLTGLTSSGIVNITNSTASTTTTTGALTVTGGVGIGGALTLANDLSVNTGDVVINQNNSFVLARNVATKDFACKISSADTCGMILNCGRGGGYLRVTTNNTSAGVNSGNIFSINNSIATNIVTVSGQNARVGINTNSPAYTLDVGGSINGTSLLINGTSVTATADELNYLDLGTGPGTAEASKALVLDSSLNISGVRRITFLGNRNVTAPVGYRNIDVSAATYTNTVTPAFSTDSVHQYSNFLGIPTFTASNSSVITTNASTLYIQGAPSGTGNMTITNPYALYIEGGASYTAGTFQIANSTTSTNSTSGALRVTGGVGIGGAVFMGSTLNVSSAVTFSSSLTVNGTISGALSSGSQTGITAVGTLTGLTSSGIVNITNNSSSTSSTTGALRVTGGIGIGGDVFSNGIFTSSRSGRGFFHTNGTLSLESNIVNILGIHTAYLGTITNHSLILQTNDTSRLRISFGGDITVLNNTASTTTSTGALIVTGGVGIGGALNVAGNINGTIGTASQTNITSVGTLTGLTSSGAVNITSSTTSTNTTTGALIITGGVGIGGTINAGGAINFTNSTASTSTTTGALRVTGGVGIGGAVNIGGDTKVNRLLVGTSTDNGRLISSLLSSMSNNSRIDISLGKANSANNQAELYYTHVADGSTSNRFSIGFFGVTNGLHVLANGNVGIGYDNPLQKLAVNGSLYSINATINDQIVIGNASNQLSTNTYPLRVTAWCPTTGTVTPAAALGTSTTIANYNSVAWGNCSARLNDNVVAAGFIAISDRRIKTNIKEIDSNYCKQFIMKCTPVSYNLKDDLIRGRNNTELGFIAQELEQNGFANLVTYLFNPDNEYLTEDIEIINGEEYISPADNLLSVSYNSIIPIITQNIKMIYDENEELKSEINELKEKNNMLENTIQNILERLSQLENN